jgi:hypothetical protein
MLFCWVVRVLGNVCFGLLGRYVMFCWVIRALCNVCFVRLIGCYVMFVLGC